VTLSIVDTQDITFTTDANGYYPSDYFPGIGTWDQVLATAATPQSGSGAALVGVTATPTGVNGVKIRCWRISGSTPPFPVEAAASEQVKVTLAFFKH
jgi:hypothetical protein